MKRYIIIIIISVSLFSCKESFLELTPLSSINAGSFYKTQKDIENAVNSAYSGLQLRGNYGLYIASIPEMRSDNTSLSWIGGNKTVEDIILFNIQTDNGLVHEIWNDLYLAVLRCNVVLDNVDEVEIDQSLKDRFTGEVKFLRALNYFNLVRLFGDVPIILKEVKSVDESYTYERRPVEEVYQQIEADLTDAESKLPVSYSAENTGRVTKGAAMGLLGKVYLTQRKYQEASAKLKQVIDLGQYSLLSNYADLWKISNENSEESLFEIQYKSGGLGEGSMYTNFFAPKFSSPYVVEIGGAEGWSSPTQNMSNAYEEGDLRKEISMAEGYYNGENELIEDSYTKKFMDNPFQMRDADNNWPVLRYADILLMYAEALNEISYNPNGEAFNMLNAVRLRAGLPPKTHNNENETYRIMSQQDFRIAIEQERRVELAFEGHRWFDLIRTDRFVEVMSNLGFSVEAYESILPIPLVEIDKNPDGLWQNPGYIQ